MGENSAAVGIYLVVEVGSGAFERLSAALAAGPVQSVLIVPTGAAGWTGAQPGRASIRRLVEMAQSAGAAALVAEDVALAQAVGADGVHLPWSADVEADYAAARRSIGRQGIVGASAGYSRHDAMVLAEAGADYIGFPGASAGPDGAVDQRELVAWWAEIFEVPCVAFDVDTAEQAGLLAVAGADFIATRLAAGVAPADASARVEMLVCAIAAGGAGGQQ